jgi:tetratricopeptide (TPR) repeat protein
MVTGQVNLALIEAQTIGLEPAITRLRQVVTDTPLAADAWSQLAVLQWNAGQKPQAITAAREATRLRPLTHANWHRLGTFLAASNQLPTAADAFQRAEALHPGDASNGYNLGLALWRTDQRADAARSWRHALRRSPEDVRMLKMAAIAAALPFPAVAATPANEAESLVRRWTAAAPDAADALALLAAVQQAAGDPAGASATLQQAANAKADLAAVRIVQALLLNDAGRGTEAIDLWQRVSTAIDQPSRRTMLREGLLHRGRAVFGD